MSELLRLARAVLPRHVKFQLLLAACGLVLIAGLDMLGVALVYPLVSLASGQPQPLPVVDRVAAALGVSEADETLVLLAVAVVSLFAIKSLASVAFAWWLGGFTNRNRAVLSTRILDSYLSRPFGQISRRSTAELVRTQQDAVNQFFLSGIYALMTAFSNLATVAGISIVLFVAAPLPTLFLVAYFTITGAIYSQFVKKPARRAGAAAMTSAHDTWRTALTALGGIKEIQLRGAQDIFVARYRTAVHEAAQANRVSGFLNGLPRHILEVLFVLAIGMAVVVTSVTMPPGSAGQTVGLLGAFVAAGFRILPAINGLLGNLTSLQAAREGTRLVARELADHHPAVASAGHGLDAFEEALCLESVSFTFPSATTPVLRDINLCIPKGSTVALVGSSGAGKTTLADIVLGFHRPQAGRVIADGTDIFSNLQGWRARIGYVPQEVFILDGTLEENIYFDRPLADPRAHDHALRQAVRRAHLEELLSELPDGLHTLLGERGSRLSGGQRQRIGLARAMYRNPDVLVLDEATSALDNVTEKRVTDVIRDMGSDVTTLVVAHRLSTVRHADVIVLLEGGQIVAQGSFETLRASSPVFAEMVRLGQLR